ncbi:MAG: RNase adapter RapZ [Clostridia bacterium]|nr:RNase adapter RapZ [Clostridia bacterium]
MEFVIITGMSGAGKGTAGHILEDMGYLCVDNIPVSLVETCVELYKSNEHPPERISFTLDIRGQEEFSELLAVVGRLKADDHCRCTLVYLDATDAVLVARYQESRHLHPLVLTKNLSLSDAIACERKLLSDLRGSADLILDSTGLRPAELRANLEAMLEISRKSGMLVTCMSFGFKHGAPADLDLLFDVRCFHNPYYIPELKPLTGLDAPVRDFVLSAPETQGFIGQLFEMITYLLPLYRAEGKTQLTIGIGCTGGQHRSVAIAEALAAHLRALTIAESECTVSVVHRDVGGKR